VSPEIAAAIAAIVIALCRELAAYIERRHRQRGDLRTRESDKHPPAG
jgi:hypothetical protein